MGLINKSVKVKWGTKNKKYYERLGYKYTKQGDEFEVKIKDLLKDSHVEVEYMCDNCNKKLTSKYLNYVRHVKEDEKYYCQKCGTALFGVQKTNKTKLSKSESFYDWCIENDRQDVLDRWDYELNECSPKDIGYSSNKKYWFKCDKHKEHKSELKNINHFANGQEGSIKCNQCNSIAQYILDNFPNKKLEEVWDYEKNEDLDPWNISRGSKIRIWIKCQEKDYHGSYEIRCCAFINGHRCPYCNKNSGKVHPLDSLGQYIIDNYGEEFLWKVWNNKNDKSPFEYSIGSKKKIWWNCPDNKHKSYKRNCKDSLRYEFRCPRCVEERKESIIEEKTRTYLEELGYEVKTEYKCSLLLKNPKTKHFLPFDNEIILGNGKHLIIEVHGKQHYDYNFYKTRCNLSKEEAEKELHYQQIKDRYKRIKCIQVGYEYLELSYTLFDKKDGYKEPINNKIKEMLES